MKRVFLFSFINLHTFIDGESRKCQIGEGDLKILRPQGLAGSKKFFPACRNPSGVVDIEGPVYSAEQIQKPTKGL